MAMLVIASMAIPGPIRAVDYDGDGIDDDPYAFDSDGDLYSDGMEGDEGTDPYDSGDYPSGFSPDLDDGTYYQEDPSTMDSDGDGYTDDDEVSQGTDPYNPAEYPGSDPMGMDSDGDGYYDDDEAGQETDPYDPSDYPGNSDPTSMDSDGDGFYDDDETGQGTDPYDPSDYPGSSDPTTMDSDSDGLSDDEESSIGTNPNLSDSDGDGLSDYTEHNGYTIDYEYFDEASQTNMPGTYGPLTTDPNQPDSDGDLLEDGWEVANSVDPTEPANGLADGDGDEMPDLWEITHLLDHNNPADAGNDEEPDLLSKGAGQKCEEAAESRLLFRLENVYVTRHSRTINDSDPSQRQREAILAELASLTTIERGALSQEYRERPAPDGRGTTRNGPYHKHQCWEKGRKRSRGVPAQEVPLLRGDLENGARFNQLIGDLAELALTNGRELRASRLRLEDEADAKENSTSNASGKDTAKPKPSLAKSRRASRKKASNA